MLGQTPKFSKPESYNHSLVTLISVTLNGTWFCTFAGRFTHFIPIPPTYFVLAALALRILAEDVFRRPLVAVVTAMGATTHSRAVAWEFLG